MPKIEYIKHDHEETLQILSNAFAQKTLVPVLGSGFTVGCKTGTGRTVPSGTMFAKEMLEIIGKEKQLDGTLLAKMAKKKFSELADFYFNQDWVASETVRSHLQGAFQHIQLPPEKTSFLNDIEWPYIYTLNADDAIETNSKYVVALPYDDTLSIRAKDERTLFKLHGDIAYELRHEQSRLIFRKADYLQALTTNRKMLDFLKLDIVNKNIIYIGCSLADELDISFIVAQQNIEDRKNTRNIVFLTEALDEIDEQAYIDVGITTAILFDDGKYEQIYELLSAAYQKSAEMTHALKEFKPQIAHLPADQKKNEDFLVKGFANINSAHPAYPWTIPFYFTKRDDEAKIHLSIQKNEISIVAGPRISGKTLSIYNVLDQYKDREIYIVSSVSRIGSSALHQLLGQKNSLIFFDSGSLTREGLSAIDRSRSKLLANKTHIIIAALPNDPDPEHFLVGPGKRTSIIKIANEFTSPELQNLNSKAIATRLPTFSEGRYLLEKIYNVFTVIGEKPLIAKIPQTKAIFFILYTIAVRHQMTGEEIYFAGLKESDVDQTVNQTSPFIAYDSISGNEIIDHTSYKIISHASSWVVAVLREFYRVKGVAWCGDTLFEFFSDAYARNKQFVQDLRKFDSLNFVFSHGKEGAANLILNLYDRLETIEGSESEFYVQKGKAYYNMYFGSDLDSVLNERVNELRMALTWAKTAHQKTAERNIVHVIALLMLRKVISNAMPSDDDLVKTVDALLDSLAAERNSTYIRNLLSGEIRGAENLKRFMKNIDSGEYKHVVLLTLRRKIDEIRSEIELAKNK